MREMDFTSLISEKNVYQDAQRQLFLDNPVSIYAHTEMVR